MKKELFSQEELDALARRNDELAEETLQIYGGWLSRDEMQTEKRAGLVPAFFACVALVLGAVGIVQWFVGCGAS